MTAGDGAQQQLLLLIILERRASKPATSQNRPIAAINGR